MKNLKRVLSLALATVMLLGMMVVGANAAFNDQSSIKYTTAVDTLVGLGVINGMEGNTFQPNGTLTRAQAAKMVAYVKAGANEATIGYYDGTTKFTDVGANHAWASGSINYAVANDMISGMTDTTYQPDAQLTGAQLAKMLLVALGFRPDTTNTRESLNGANWQINAIRMAQQEGLFKGLTNFVATRAITREEACQVIYNALTAETKKISSAADGFYIYEDDPDNPQPILLADAFGAEEARTSEDDAFGRPTTTYEFTDGKDDVVITAQPVLTYTTGVTEGQLYTDLSLKAGDDATVSFIVDGKTPAEDVTLVKGSKDAITATGAGVLTEVFKTDDGFLAVCVNTYLATVDTVTEANAETDTPASVDVSLVGSPSGITLTENTIKATGFKENDLVLITAADGEVKSVDAVNTVDGTLSASGTGYIRVSGTRYDTSAKHVITGIGDSITDTVYTFYLDTYGNVIGNTVKSEGEASSDFLYVNSSAANAFSAFNGSATVKAAVTMTDGTNPIISLAVKDADKAGSTYWLNGTYEGHTITDSTTIAEGWYSYTVSNGSYRLTAVSELAYATSGVGSALTLNGSASVVTGKLATASTKLTLVNANKAYTGYTNFKNLSVDDAAKVLLVTAQNDTTKLTNIYVLGNGGETQAVTYAYAEKTAYTEYDADGYHYNFFVDGKETSYCFAVEQSLTAGKVYSIEVDGDGLATVSPVTTTAITVAGSDSGYIVASADVTVDGKTSTVLYLDNDTVLYDVTNGVRTINSVANGNKLTAVVTKGTDGELHIAVAYLTAKK